MASKSSDAHLDGRRSATIAQFRFGRKKSLLHPINVEPKREVRPFDAGYLSMCLHLSFVRLNLGSKVNKMIEGLVGLVDPET
jgi:hypothetical protein